MVWIVLICNCVVNIFYCIVIVDNVVCVWVVVVVRFCWFCSIVVSLCVFNLFSGGDCCI